MLKVALRGLAGRKLRASRTGKPAFTNTNGNGVQVPSFPESLLAKVKALPGVNAAAGGVSDAQTKLVDRNGKVIVTHGAPALGFSVDPNDHTFNPLQLVSGTYPTGANEVAIDAHTASSKHFNPGDTIGVETRGPVQHFRISGIVKLPGVAIGSATIAAFDLRTAQRLLQRPGGLDIIRVQSKSGVKPSTLIRE